MKVKDQITQVVNRDIINSLQRVKFVEVLKLLREDKYISKKEIENAMSQYLVLTDDKINDYLHTAMITTINYEAVVVVLKSYEKGVNEVNDMMDNLNYAKND